MKFRNLYLVEVFHAVMKTGSMTGAARLLNLSQPSVTKYIQTLEELVDTKLFSREARGVTPTPTALIMFEDVHALFDQANNIYRLMESVSRTSRRGIRIGVLPVLGSRFIADVVSGVGKEHKDLDLYIVVKDSAILKGWINAGRLDLAIVSDSGYGSGVSIAKSPMVCIMPYGHPLTSKKHVTPADLLNYDYVAFESDSPLQASIDRALRESSVKVYPRAVVTTTSTLVELVGAGLGLSIVHPFALIDAHTPLVSQTFIPDISWGYRVISNSTLRNSRLVTLLTDRIKNCASTCLENLRSGEPKKRSK